jgi:hypothetical protein
MCFPLLKKAKIPSVFFDAFSAPLDFAQGRLLNSCLFKSSTDSEVPWTALRIAIVEDSGCAVVMTIV